MPGVLIRREIWTKMQDRETPCEDTGRRWPFNKPKREASEETNPADTLISDF